MGRPRTNLTKTEEQFSKLRDQTREWKKRFPEKVQLAGRKYELRKKYGLSYDDYLSMVEDQDGKCALCGEDKQLVVDHCHVTKKVRKLICRLCNTGLGMFKDNPEVLRKASKYVQLEDLEK